MTARTKQVGIILTLVAMISFGAWPFWKALYFNIASTALEQRAREVVQQNPSLKIAWDVALADGILTESEAQMVVKGAGEESDVQE